MLKLMLNFAIAAGLLVSCNNAHSPAYTVHRTLFEWLGVSWGLQARSLTTKQLHFDVGTMVGETVVVEGRVVNWGDHGTYLVVDDDYGRLLVVLTKLHYDLSYLKPMSEHQVKVLGVVERGKKGLPLVLAHAVYVESAAALQ